MLVIGAGAVGLCCAHALRRAGASVAILDAATTGSGASYGNIGWMTPTLAAPLRFPAAREGVRALTSRQGPLLVGAGLKPGLLRWLWRFHRSARPERFRASLRALVALAEASHAELDRYRDEGVDFESHATGLLTVAASPRGLDWLLELFDILQEVGYQGRLLRLDGDAAREREPALGHQVEAAAHTSIDRYVRPESLCAGLATHLQARGVHVRSGVAVRRLHVRGEGVLAETSAGALTARSVIVATGAAANTLLAPLGCRLPIVAAKGYSITLAGVGTRPRGALYLSEPRVGMSPYWDAVRIGGFFELGAGSGTVPPERTARLVADAARYLRNWRPAAAERTPEGWAGFRPSTPDSLPYIGEVPGTANVYLAVGHGMLGLTLAPATGELLAQGILAGRQVGALMPFAFPRTS